jgi:hypothetical protein
MESSTRSSDLLSDADSLWRKISWPEPILLWLFRLSACSVFRIAFGAIGPMLPCGKATSQTAHIAHALQRIEAVHRVAELDLEVPHNHLA